MKTRKKIVAMALAVSMAIGMLPAIALPAAASTETSVNEDVPLRLWYDEEAPYGQENTIFGDGGRPNDPNDGWERWSIPLGNGYFGANVFGRTDSERIQLTEKTLCNTYGYSLDNAGGLNNFSETYLDFGHSFDSVSEYSRELDLETAVSKVSYVYDGVAYEREYFTSYEDYCMVIKLTADTAEALSFTLRPTIPYLCDFTWNNNNEAQGRYDGVTKHGRVTSSVTEDGAVINLFGNMGQYNVDFEAEYRVFTDGTVSAGSWTHTYTTEVDSSVTDSFNSGVRDDEAQTLTVTNGTLEISGATEAYILVTLGTNYDQSKGAGNSSIYKTGTNASKLDEAGVDAKAANDKRMADALAQSFDKYSTIAEGYNALKTRHIEDYSNLFGRVSFNLDIDEGDLDLTTDELLSNYKTDTGNGHYLEMLYYQYGRYLLIASSRETTLPANLQGTWNRYKYAPWGAGYWHNVNEQMNYWPAFSTNLAETFEAYIGFQQAYMAKAKTNAQTELYRAPFNYQGGNTGFTLGIGVTPYTVGSSVSCGELGFTTQLYWEYYMYTGDETILRDIVYPVLYEAAAFITKTVAYNESEDAYLSIYSYSPEQYNGGSSWYYTEGTTYAQSFAYLNNVHLLKAAEILGKEDDEIITEVKRQIDKYDAILVGYSGQVKEFREEYDYGDIGEYAHRHISQLVGLFPGEMINANTPAWLDAAIVTLTERGDKATGWGVAHRLNLWAHTKLGDRTYMLLEQLLKSNTATNLWDLHIPFQIDGNFGGTSGITEMLLQSHEGYIEPLAAIPSSWASGSYNGLVARGNFVVGADWANGSLTKMTVEAPIGGTVRLKAQGIASATVKTSGGQTVAFTAENADLISFATTVGETYTVTSIPARVTVAPAKELSVTQSSASNYALTWAGSADAASYNVYKAVEDAPDYTLLGNTASTSYVYSAPTEETNARITYRVTAVNADGRESTGALVYCNPSDVSVAESQAVILADGSLQVVVGTEDEAEVYTLYKYNTDTSSWEVIEESAYPVIVYDGYSSTDRYAVSAGIGYFDSEITEITEFGEIGADGGLVEDTSHNIFEGTTADMVTLSHGVYSNYYAVNCFDGNYETRMAPVDKQNVAIVLTVTLSATYYVKNIRIYDFGAAGAATRSDNTTIEAYADGVWTPILSGFSLDRVSGELYCDIDLGFAKAEKLRFSFMNTQAVASASIYEIEGTAAKPSFADRTELLAAVEAADKMDMSGYDLGSQTRFAAALGKAKATLGNVNADQGAVDSAKAKLAQTISSMPEGDDLDLGVTENVYTGDNALTLGNINLPTEGGVGGKAEDDLAYYMGESRKYSFNDYKDQSLYGKDYTVEFNILLEELAVFTLFTKTVVTCENGVLGADGWNGGPQINMNGGNITVSNGTVIAINGVPTEGGVSLGSYKTGEWKRVAFVAPITTGEMTTAMDIVIDGTRYTISVTNPFYGISYCQFEKTSTTSARIYLDNIACRTDTNAIYYQDRDMPNSLVSTDETKVIVKDMVVQMKDFLTVGALKALVGSEIRVFSTSALESIAGDEEYFIGDEVIVSYAKNGRSYERVYQYYTVTVPTVNSNSTSYDCDDGGYPFNEKDFATAVNGVLGNSTDAWKVSTPGKSTYTIWKHYGPTASNDWTVEFTVLSEDANSQISFYTKYTDSSFGFSLYMGNGSIYLNKATAVSGGSSKLNGSNATLCTMNTGEWYRFAVVFPCDATTESDTVYIYINGVKYTVTLSYSFNTIKYTAFRNQTGVNYLDDITFRDENFVTYRPALDTPPTLSSTDNRIVITGDTAKLGVDMTVAELRLALGNSISVLRNAAILGDGETVAKGDRIVVPTTDCHAYGYYTTDMVVPKVDIYNCDDGGYPFNEKDFATTVNGAFGNPTAAFMASLAGKSTYTSWKHYGPTEGNDWIVEFSLLAADSSSNMTFYTKYTGSNFGFTLYMGNGSIYLNNSTAVSGGTSTMSGSSAYLCSMNAGEWYRVAIVFPCDSVNYGNTVYIYVNGVKYTVTLNYSFNHIVYTAFKNQTGTNYLDDIVFTDTAYANYDYERDYAPTLAGGYDGVTISGNKLYMHGMTVGELKAVLGVDIAVLNGSETLGEDALIAVGSKLVILPAGGEYSYGYYTIAENTAHSYGEAYETLYGCTKKVCSVCGDAVITDATEADAIYAHSVSFQNNLNLNYYITLDNYQDYDTIALFVERSVYENGERVVAYVTLDSYTVTDDGYLRFSYRDIAACHMGDEMRATLYLTKGDEVYASGEDVYSIKIYAYNRLKASTDEEFKALLVDMLNYGAAAQVYFGYDTENLVNAELTEAERGYATPEVNPNNVSGKSDAPENERVFLKGVSAVFNNAVELKYYITLAEGVQLSDIRLVFTYTTINGVERTVTVKGSELVWNGEENAYSARLADIAACDMAQVITAYAMEGESIVSATVSYSVESYCAKRIEATDDASFRALLESLVKYSTSAGKYFEINN